MHQKLSHALLAGGILAVAPLAAHALDVEFSGQIARGVMHADDGATSETHFVDPGPSLTRFRFTGTQEVSAGLTAGIRLEWQYLSNPTASVTNEDKTVDPSLDERHVLAFFRGGFGRIGIGQTDGAANGVVESDLSGTSIIATPLIQAYGGAIPFHDGAGAAGPTVTQVINNLDFESRYDLVRYDTPKFGPVVLSVSRGVKDNDAGMTGDGDVTEAAARYTGDLGAGGRIRAALGYSTRDAGGAAGDVVTTGGSVSWLMPSGISLTLAHANRDDDAGTPDDTISYAKIGYLTGPHAIGLEFGRGEDQNVDGGEADLVGIGYVYSAADWADLFAGYRVYSLDQGGTEFEDISLTTVGTLLKF